jgi:uncharacterized protein
MCSCTIEALMLTATYILGFRTWALRLRVMWGLLLGGWAAGAWGEPVQALSRPTRNTWVVDVTGTLRDATLAEVDRLGSEVERSGRGQLVVAVVSTTDGRPARTFATELFNRWGIGHARRDDGALLFIALRDRKAEIILGDGVDTPEDVARSRELMRESIVPAFRGGDPNVAVLAGARGLKALLESAPINRGLGQPLALPQRPAEPQPSKKPEPKKAAQPVREPKEFLDDEGMYVELSTSGSSEGEEAASSTSAAEERPPASGSTSRREGGTGASQQTSVSPWAWGVVGGFFLLLIVGNWLRRRSVACERCGSTNVKVSTFTLLDAGEHSDGLVEMTVRCRRCGHVGTSTRMTSSRSHSHSHSHRGSHGGSHGGGRSSGGGASGSW